MKPDDPVTATVLRPAADGSDHRVGQPRNPRHQPVPPGLHGVVDGLGPEAQAVQVVAAERHAHAHLRQDAIGGDAGLGMPHHAVDVVD